MTTVDTFTASCCCQPIYPSWSFNNPSVNITDIIKTQASIIQNIKEQKENDMNIFGLNTECGLSKDPNIANTLMGIAVKNNQSWRIYNKEKQTLTDIGNIKIGNLPLFIMPSTKLVEGDLIKKDGNYFYVIEIGDGRVKTLSAATGKIEEIVPVDNILGIHFYSKVISLTQDLLDLEDDDEDSKLIMAMAMSNDNADQNGANLILPMLLLKDKSKDSDEDSKSKKIDKILRIIMLSSLSNGDNNGTNSLLPLLLLKKDLF